MAKQGITIKAWHIGLIALLLFGAWFAMYQGYIHVDRPRSCLNW